MPSIPPQKKTATYFLQYEFLGQPLPHVLPRQIWYMTKGMTYDKQEAQLMLTTGSTRLAVSRGQQTWYHSTCYI